MSELTPPIDIENASALTTLYGRWPSFHDAEVHALTFERNGPEAPLLDARIHLFRMTDEVDARGYYVRRDHRLVTLRLTKIACAQVAWFNEQNAITGVTFEPADPQMAEGRRWHVQFRAAYGCEVDLVCDRVVVRAVELYDRAP